MTAKEILQGRRAATAKREQLEQELCEVYHGPRSKQDALRYLEAIRADLAATWKLGVREALLGYPLDTSTVATADRYSALVIGQTMPDLAAGRGFMSALVLRRMGSLERGSSLLPLVFYLGWEKVEALFREVLDELPATAFGPSQADREKREKRLQKELTELAQEIDRLEQLWTEEVGPGVECPA